MELIDVITSKENLNRAYKKVVANKGTGGVDGMKFEELGTYIRENKDKIIQSIRSRTYIPKPVRMVYIPKGDGKTRPLEIPTALERVIQQAIAQSITDIYEEIFSEFNHDHTVGSPALPVVWISPSRAFFGTSRCRADWGLSPFRNVRRRAHQK